MNRYFSSVTGGLMMLGLVAGAAQAATVRVVPSASSVRPGETVTLSVVGTEFTDRNVDAGDFRMWWDDGVLSYVSIAFVDPPWDASFVDDANAASGSLDQVAVLTSIPGGVGPDFGVAVLTFDVVGAVGRTTTVSAEDRLGWVAPGSIPIDVSYANAEVSVVPVPAAVWLLGSALVGLGGVAGRRKVAQGCSGP